MQRALGVAAVPQAHQREVYAVGRHGLPIDGALVAGHVDAKARAQRALLVIGQPVAVALQAGPVVGAHVSCRGAGRLRAAAERRSADGAERARGDECEQQAKRVSGTALVHVDHPTRGQRPKTHQGGKRAVYEESVIALQLYEWY